MHPMNDLSRLIQQEEAKRDRCVDPREQWKVLQATIAWVDSQQEVPRNSMAGCLAAQRAQLKRREQDSGDLPRRG